MVWRLKMHSCICNLNVQTYFKIQYHWHPCFYVPIADLRDDEASQQVESTQLAAAEIERLVEEKQRLAEHLQQEVLSTSTLTCIPSLFPSFSLLISFSVKSINFLSFACMYIKRGKTLAKFPLYSVSTIQDTFSLNHSNDLQRVVPVLYFVTSH